MGQGGKGFNERLGGSPTLHDFVEMILLKPLALQELPRFLFRVEPEQKAVIPSICRNQSP
jgi:hypothetical protein